MTKFRVHLHHKRGWRSFGNGETVEEARKNARRSWRDDFGHKVREAHTETVMEVGEDGMEKVVADGD